MSRKNNQSGFTLVELLVVIALLLIVLSTSIFSYDRFGKDVELENSVYSMALAIREAQTYGVNKKAREGTSDPKDFGEDYGYGIHFTNITSGTSTNSKTFVLFEDKGGSPNEVFDVGLGCISGEECFSQILLTKGNEITKIWADGSDIYQRADIFFKRPNPDAKIKVISGGSTVSVGRVGIVVKDPTKVYARCVEVGVAGDITIKRVNTASNDECI